MTNARAIGGARPPDDPGDHARIAAEPPTSEDLPATRTEQPEPWQPGRARLGPAMIIVGIVGFVAIGGFLLAAFGAQHHVNPSKIGERSSNGITAVPAKSALARITTNANPPSDIVAALVLPASAAVTGTLNSDKGIGLYDRSILCSVAAPESRVVGFYKSELASAGWKIDGVDSTADGRGEAIFATRPSADGFYWEVGAVVEPANPSLSPALAGGDTAPTSDLKLRLFEVDDDS